MFLVGGGLLWRFDRARDPTVEASATAAQSAAPAPARDEKSIAVLPFADMSSGKDQEYFADGLSEELLNLLAKLPELRVIGRTSSFQFKGRNEDLRVIGEKLNDELAAYCPKCQRWAVLDLARLIADGRGDYKPVGRRPRTVRSCALRYEVPASPSGLLLSKSARP